MRCWCCAVAVALMLPSGGCGGSGASHPASTTPSAARTSTSPVDAIVSSWNSGKKDAAVQLLVQQSHTDLLKDTQLDALRVSEKDYQSAWRSEQSRYLSQMVELAGTLKELARYAQDKGREKLQQGNTQEARALFQGVHSLGKSLTSAKLTVVINQLGHALVASSSEDLAQLPAQQSPTP